MPGCWNSPETIRSSSGPPSRSEHLGKERIYWRDIILGCNDGLVSTFLLVTGVVGGGVTNMETLLLTSISGSVAGAVSMFAGEFLATRSQDEIMQGEAELEENHIMIYMNDELNELEELLERIGIYSRKSYSENIVGDCINFQSSGNKGTAEATRERKLFEMLFDYYSDNPPALLKAMNTLEFGFIDDERRNPFMAGLTSMATFFLGSFPSIVPLLVCHNPQTGLFAAGIGTSMGLFCVGAAKSLATRNGLIRGGVENLIIAGIGATFAYGVGVKFGSAVSI
eukprot:115097_1